MRSLSLWISVLMLATCGKIPDATTQYYLTRSDLRVDVTRTLSCALPQPTPTDEISKSALGKTRGGEVETEQNFLIVSTSANPLITNYADLTNAYTFDLQKLKGTFTDPDAKVSFYSDGRLKAINSTQVGTAQQVLGSVLGTVSAVFKARNDPDGTVDRTQEIDKACKKISQYARDEAGRTVVLQYSKTVTVASGSHQTIDPTKESWRLHQEFQPMIGDVHVRISEVKPLNHPVKENASESDKEEPATVKENDATHTLKARQLSRVVFGVHTSTGEELWQGTVLMALENNNDYDIPLPTRPAFGTAKFEVAFDDSGALSDLKYAATSGASSAIDLVGTVATEVQGPSAADQAAALQAEADLIKQRQRLANCRADPANCD